MSGRCGRVIMWCDGCAVCLASVKCMSSTVMKMRAGFLGTQMCSIWGETVPVSRVFVSLHVAIFINGFEWNSNT